ncbi:MAG: SH3 domain-containing protein [Anaerolineae bacterium]|nr:SH3 domain-containing protein [Anaerolineae bacterium]
MRRIVVFSLLLLVAAVPVFAQDVDCLTLIQQVIETVRENCTELDLNQACYGNPSLEVEPRENVRVDFGEPGDLLTLSALQSLTTRPLNLESEFWGFAQLDVRADLIASGLTVLAFGEVTLQNESTAPSDFIALDITVREPTGANLRAEPSPDAEVLGQIYAGSAVKALGRLEDGSWLRLLNGWVAVELVRSDYDLSLLPVYADDDPAPESIYGPMQAFRFRTGFEDSPCTGAPDSGLLIQSPDGTSDIRLIVNGSSLVFTGTLLLQTTVEGKTLASVLEGYLYYSDNGLIEAGDLVTYGYQGDNIIYEDPQDYNYARARYLPLVLLPREFELPYSIGGLLFPFTPGTGFLNTVPADGPCTVAWSVDVNLRSGPGTDYPIRQGIPSGFYSLPDARAQGTDGAVWWRLAEGFWIAANNTAAGGSCGTLPLVAPPALPSN